MLLFPAVTAGHRILYNEKSILEERYTGRSGPVAAVLVTWLCVINNS